MFVFNIALNLIVLFYFINQSTTSYLIKKRSSNSLPTFETCKLDGDVGANELKGLVESIMSKFDHTDSTKGRPIYIRQSDAQKLGTYSCTEVDRVISIGCESPGNRLSVEIGILPGASTSPSTSSSLVRRQQREYCPTVTVICIFEGDFNATDAASLKKNLEKYGRPGGTKYYALDSVVEESAKNPIEGLSCTKNNEDPSDPSKVDHNLYECKYGKVPYTVAGFHCKDSS